MRTPTVRVSAFVFAGLTLLPAAEPGWFPLEEGNTWVYLSAGSPEPVTVTVGARVAIGGESYYQLSGYVGRDLPVRLRAGDGALCYWDERVGKDVLLTSFSPSQQGLPAPERSCNTQQQPEAGREEYEGPLGRLGTQLTIHYSSQCADAGITREAYIDGLGMVRRVFTTFAGPRTYDLVYARVSGKTIGTPPVRKPVERLHVTLEALEPKRLIVRLNLSASQPIALSFRTSQEYDVVLRNADRAILTTWSRGKVFAQAAHERVISGNTEFIAELPLTKPLGPSIYFVEAWMTSGASQHEFASELPFEVPVKPSAQRLPAPVGRRNSP